MTDQTQGADNAGGDNGGGDGLPSAAEILAFDPFGPAGEVDGQPSSAEPKTPAIPADASGGQSGKTPVAAAQAEPKPQVGADGKPLVAAPVDPNAKPTTPATPPAPSAAELANLIRAQTESITAALQTKPAAAEAEPGEAPPKYNLALPPQVVNLLRSEDVGEFQQGMHAVINGISNKIWTDVSAHVDGIVQKLVSERIPAIMEERTTSATTRARVAQDFYTAHENLNNPALKPLIQNVGLQVVQRRQAAGLPIDWSPEVRDEIAETVYTQLPQLRPAAAAAAPAAKSRVPFVAGGGARPTLVPDASSEFAEMLTQ